MIPAKDRKFMPWTPDQDAILMALGGHRIDKRGWQAIATRIPGRSAAACRIRYYSLSCAARTPADRKPPRERRRSAEMLADAKAGMQAPIPELPKRVPFPIAVALILGDPLPGRSALDAKLQRQNGATS